MSYKTIFQKSLGMSTVQNGLLQSIERIVALIAPPLFGMISDHFSAHKTVMLSCLLLYSTLTMPGYFIPAEPHSSARQTYCANLDFNKTRNEMKNHFVCNKTDGNSENILCHGEGQIICSNLTQVYQNFTHDLMLTMAAANTKCNSTVNCNKPQLTSTVDVYELTFWLLLVFNIVYSFTFSPLGPLVDAIVFHILGKDNSKDYGKQRLWGSVGYGITALLCAYLIDFYTNAVGAVEKDYLFAFVCMNVFGLISALVVCFLEVPRHEKRPSMLSGLRLIVTDLRIALLVWITLTSSIVQTIKYSYLFWYGESLEGASQTYFGFSILADCLGEVPMFFVADWFIRKLGHKMSLVIGLVMLSIRTWMYIYLTHAWHLIITELFNGFCFALPMAAMCTYVYQLAPDGMTATLMSLVQGVYWGLGNVLGNAIGGVLYKYYGPINMFKICSMIGFVGAITFVIPTVIHQKYRAKSKPINEAKEDEVVTKPLNQLELKVSIVEE